MTLKIALVGTGNVAKRNYVPCLSDQEDVELGYYNRTRTKAEAIAEEFGGAVFDSLEALTAWNPDSIFVLTRETERRAVIAALLALKPRRLFCEKPLVAQHGQADVRAEDFLAARDLFQQAAAQDCETAMIFNYRFFDQPLKAKELIAARDFGQTVNITGPVHYACWQQYDASFVKSILAYLESLRQGQPPPVPGIAGLQELQVEAAIKRSIAQQRPVDLAAELPLAP